MAVINAEVTRQDRSQQRAGNLVMNAIPLQVKTRGLGSLVLAESLPQGGQRRLVALQNGAPNVDLAAVQRQLSGGHWPDWSGNFLLGRGQWLRFGSQLAVSQV